MKVSWFDVIITSSVVRSDSEIIFKRRNANVMAASAYVVALLMSRKSVDAVGEFAPSENEGRGGTSII